VGIVATSNVVISIYVLFVIGIFLICLPLKTFGQVPYESSEINKKLILVEEFK
jgi:hypothetical protein